MTEKQSLVDFVRSIPAAKTVPGTSWITDGHMRGTIEAMQHLDPTDRTLRLIMVQDGDAWISLAEVPLHEKRGRIAFVQFSLLSFIAAWNERRDRCRIRNGDIKIELLLDVRDPYVYRHPSMMPMELTFNKKSSLFEKSMIYPTGIIAESTFIERPQV